MKEIGSLAREVESIVVPFASPVNRKYDKTDHNTQ